MQHPPGEEELILQILSQIAHENALPLGRVKRLLLVKRNAAINQQFWEILDDMLPLHPFDYVGQCHECGTLHLLCSDALFLSAQ